MLANIFVWQASGSVDTRSAPQKCCPSWISSFSLWGVADAMTDWKLFLSARTLPGLPLYYKHWCVRVCSTLWANNCQTFYHRISLWLASNNKLFVPRREEDHLNSCRAAKSLELTMRKAEALTSRDAFRIPVESVISMNFKWDNLFKHKRQTMYTTAQDARFSRTFNSSK